MKIQILVGGSTLELSVTPEEVTAIRNKVNAQWPADQIPENDGQLVLEYAENVLDCAVSDAREHWSNG